MAKKNKKKNSLVENFLVAVGTVIAICLALLPFFLLYQVVTNFFKKLALVKKLNVSPKLLSDFIQVDAEVLELEHELAALEEQAFSEGLSKNKDGSYSRRSNLGKNLGRISDLYYERLNLRNTLDNSLSYAWQEYVPVNASLTAASLALVSLIFVCSKWYDPSKEFLEIYIPAALFSLMTYFVFWLVNKVFPTIKEPLPLSELSKQENSTLIPVRSTFNSLGKLLGAAAIVLLYNSDFDKVDFEQSMGLKHAVSSQAPRFQLANVENPLAPGSLETEQVKVFIANGCVGCAALLTQLEASGISHNILSLDLDDEALSYYLSKYGRGRIPLTQVGDWHIRGNEFDAIAEHLKYKQ